MRVVEVVALAIFLGVRALAVATEARAPGACGLAVQGARDELASTGTASARVVAGGGVVGIGYAFHARPHSLVARWLRYRFAS